MATALVETPDYLRWRRVLGRRHYDLEIPVDHPAEPDSLIDSLRHRAIAPDVILAGFERYVASAYLAATAFAAVPSGQSPHFGAP